MSNLDLSFLGSLQVKLDGQPVKSFEADKVRALLAYLAVESEHPHRREQLAALFWPGWPDASARTSLRNALSNLRHAIGDETAEPPFLLITRETLQFNPESDFSLDLAEVERLAGDGHATLDQLQSALVRCRGSFLEGFTLKDCPAFDDWSLIVRERAQQQASALLSRLAEQYEQSKEYDKAIGCVRERLELEPWQEEAHRQMMRLLAASGQRAAALAQFEACRRSLKNELGVEPAEETVRLYEKIRDSQTLEPAQKQEHPHNLPAQLTSFVGREKEIAEIRRLFNQTRLLTLSGVGGTGKTRLALEVASGWVEDFEHGVWLVELARITDPALIPSNLASLFGLREEAGSSIEKMLHNHLQNKHLLLILDNCEHLIIPVALFAESVLHVAPGVKILATSREALGLTGETIYLVPSLEIPDLAELKSLERLANCEAVCLFIERASSVLPTFTLTEANAPAVAQICQRLDGIPLALELAAARLKVLSVENITARLSDRFRLLTGGSRAALPRQQTLQATIDWSYELLTDLERTLFRRLAVFLGGWTLAAAEVICACQELDSNQVLDTLASLVNKSLVTADLYEGQVKRYHMLETIRHFALEKLFEAGETLQVREAHLSFYVEWAEVQEARLKAADQITAIFEMDAEIHNIRSALGWAFDEGPHPLQGLQLSDSMAYYFDLRGLDINPWLDQGLKLIQGEDIQQLNVRAKAYLIKGHQYFLMDPVGSSFWLNESKKLYRMTENRNGLALSLAYLGACFAEMGHPDFDQAWKEVKQAEKILQEHGEKWNLAEVLHMQLWISQLQGDIKSAQQFYIESTAIYKNSGDMIKYTDVGLCITKAFQELYGFREQYELIAQDRIALGGRMNSKYIMEKGYHALALSALYKKDFSTMEMHLQRILGLLKEREANQRSIIYATRLLGIAALLQGKIHLARQRFLEYLSLAQAIQDAGGILMFPILMAGLADLEGHPQAAVRLIGAFETQLEMRGKYISEIEQDQYQYISATARSHLDEATFEAERAEGRKMTQEQAIVYAKEVTHA